MRITRQVAPYTTSMLSVTTVLQLPYHLHPDIAKSYRHLVTLCVVSLALHDEVNDSVIHFRSWLARTLLVHNHRFRTFCGKCALHGDKLTFMTVECILRCNRPGSQSTAAHSIGMNSLNLKYLTTTRTTYDHLYLSRGTIEGVIQIAWLVSLFLRIRLEVLVRIYAAGLSRLYKFPTDGSL